MAAQSAPLASLSTSTIAFGNQTVNTTSSVQSLTVTNTGGQNLVISSASISPSQFAYTAPSSTTIAPGASATYSVTFTPSSTQSYTGSLILTTNASSPTSTIALSGTGVAAASTSPCGQVDDGLAHTPPNYTTFVVGAKGTTYTDQQFGCPVTRLTNGPVDSPNTHGIHYWGAQNPVNANDTLVLVEEGSAMVTDMLGNIIIPQSQFSSHVNTLNIAWSKSNPDVLYAANGNTFYSGTLNTSAGTITWTALHSFSQYGTVVVPEQTDLSDDGTTIWLVGSPASGDQQAFQYVISTNTVGSGTVDVGQEDSGCGWHKIQAEPLGRLFIQWNCNGSTKGGTEIYNADGTLYKHLDNGANHADIGKDLNGNVVAVSMWAQGTSANGCPSSWGIGVLNVATGTVQTCLLNSINGPGGDFGYHLSYRDGGGVNGPGWVLLSTWENALCSSGANYSCFDLSSNWASQWGHMYEELDLIKIDGSSTIRLAHTRSRSGENYWAIPLASISTDGNYVIFNSNMDISTTGISDYADVYAVHVQ
jgi:hypothetical protein